MTWNTFLGGDGNDWGTGIVTDGNGNVYIAGYSEATWGNPLLVYNNNLDGFAAKLNSNGVGDAAVPEGGGDNRGGTRVGGEFTQVNKIAAVQPYLFLIITVLIGGTVLSLVLRKKA